MNLLIMSTVPQQMTLPKHCELLYSVIRYSRSNGPINYEHRATIFDPASTLLSPPVLQDGLLHSALIVISHIFKEHTPHCFKDSW
jgi:hypothetical protein